MVTIYRDMQVESISTRLNIPKTVVKKMLTEYNSYLSSTISRGHSIKFLNLFYLVCEGDKGTHETLAYTAHKVGEFCGISSVVAFRILEEYQQTIIEDLNTGFTYNIRGLANLSRVDYPDGRSVILARKSTKYDGYDIKISQTRYLRNCLKR